jgi:hypothetical protein
MPLNRSDLANMSRPGRREKIDLLFDNQSGNVIENKQQKNQSFPQPHDLYENNMAYTLTPTMLLKINEVSQNHESKMRLGTDVQDGRCFVPKASSTSRKGA